MEQALYVSKTGNLKYYRADFTRLYFGQEFCERLLPAPEELEQALVFASRNNLRFSLVTPYVTDSGLDHLCGLFDLLAQHTIEVEVVFNDWGVLHVLRHEYRDLIPVMGRLLNKMKRGPRITNILDKAPQETQQYFRASGFGVPHVAAYLKKHSIGRVEFDNLLQGIDFDEMGTSLCRSLYMPFAFVSTTRICLTANCEDPAMAERVGIFPCGKECQRYAFHLENPVMSVPLIRKGNTIFFLNEQVPDVVGKRQVDRVVIQPEIPL